MAAGKIDNSEFAKSVIARSSKGRCFKCGAELGRVATCNHIIKERPSFGSDEECTIVEITGYGSKGYWMLVEASAEAKLLDIDVFLRDAWMECCGHLSRFNTGSGSLWGGTKLSKTIPLRVLPKGLVVTYIYDFGTSSAAEIKILGRSVREKCKGAVRVLARNDPLPLRCGKCGGSADHVIWDSAYDGAEYSALCIYCCGELGCGEDYAPISNSPRMGVCGYCGEFDAFMYAGVGSLPESPLMSIEEYREHYGHEDYDGDECDEDYEDDEDDEDC